MPLTAEEMIEFVEQWGLPPGHAPGLVEDMRAEMDGDTDIRQHSVRIITLRKPRGCPHCNVKWHPGSRMYKERAIVEGKWESAYMCLPCLDKHVLLHRGETP